MRQVASAFFVIVVALLVAGWLLRAFGSARGQHIVLLGGIVARLGASVVCAAVAVRCGQSGGAWWLVGIVAALLAVASAGLATLLIVGLIRYDVSSQG